jgi:ATP-dependent DNA helicase RecQ
LDFQQLGISREAFLSLAALRRNGAICRPEGPLDADERELFERLRLVRREIADEMNVPAFVVFSDKTLRAVARARPATEDALLGVKGVGPKKAAAFGERFLAALQDTSPHD